MELIFVRNLLSSLQVKYGDTIVVHLYNIGAIFIANNFSASGRSKHIDTRLHFVRGLVEDGVITIKSVRSADNLQRMSMVRHLTDTKRDLSVR